VDNHEHVGGILLNNEGSCLVQRSVETPRLNSNRNGIAIPRPGFNFIIVANDELEAWNITAQNTGCTVLCQSAALNRRQTGTEATFGIVKSSNWNYECDMP
jgi:hypothetical protein